MTLKVERDVIEARLSEICESHDGRITPELTVTEAANPESPLHPLFEWDDSIAGHQYRLTQARQLLRSVRVLVRSDNRKIIVPYYVRDPDAGDEQGYTSLASVKSDRSKATEVALHEFRMAEASLKRARNIADALGIEGDVDQLIEQLGAVKEKVTEE